MKSSGAMLRVLFAAVLFLAGAAGARLQAEAAAMRAMLGGADLCLSDPSSRTEAPAGDAHPHDQCLACAQPLADAPGAISVAAGQATLSRAPTARPAAAPAPRWPADHPARGPPHLA